MRIIAVMLFITCLGCSNKEESFQIPDTGVLAGTDSCITTSFFSCGTCGFQCSPSNADGCVQGVCQCGTELACDDTSDCRFGRCVKVDYTGDSCEFDDACEVGRSCIEGHCTPTGCSPEVCDGIDNNCDGAIDGTNTMPLAEYCLGDKPLEMADLKLNPPCQVGVRVCKSGEWSACRGGISPEEELGLKSCDGIDNDCDGCVDSVYNGGVCIGPPNPVYDIVYLIDISASMASKIDAVIQATRLHASTYQTSSNHRFAIVVIGDSSYNSYFVRLDLTNFAQFNLTLDFIDAFGGSIEFQWDAIRDLGDGTLALNWHPNSFRILLLFTDEEGQGTSETAMCAALTHGEKLVSVVNSAYETDFDDCGTVVHFQENPQLLANQLLQTITNPCAN